MIDKDIEAHIHMTFKFSTDKSNTMKDIAMYVENAIANYLETKLGLVDVNIYDSRFIDYDLDCMCVTCGHRNNEVHANWCDYKTTTRTSEYGCDTCGREVADGHGMYTPHGDRVCEDCYIQNIISKEGN